MASSSQSAHFFGVQLSEGIYLLTLHGQDDERGCLIRCSVRIIRKILEKAQQGILNQIIQILLRPAQARSGAENQAAVCMVKLLCGVVLFHCVSPKFSALIFSYIY